MRRKDFSRLLVRMACVVLQAMIRTLAFTYRYREVGLQNLSAAESLGRSRGYLLACWHEIVLGMALSQQGRAYCTITSRANAGTVIAYLMRKMGFFPIQGSQSSGGKEVREAALEYLQRGIPVAITVDGSSGPRRRVKPGIIDLAIKSGAPILPAFAFPDRAWVLNSWDRFRLPRPFARITVVYGAPIQVTNAVDPADFEAKLSQVARALNDAEAAAESLANLGKSDLKFRRLPAPLVHV